MMWKISLQKLVIFQSPWRVQILPSAYSHNGVSHMCPLSSKGQMGSEKNTFVFCF